MHSSFTILDNHFLSNDECNDIKNKLLQNKGYWQKTHVKYFDYFPVGLYVNTERHFYSKNVTMYKKLMYDLFGLYYGRLQIVLEKSLNLKLNYHDNLHYPGFHISNGNPMLMPNFHTDGFYNFYEYLSKKESLFFRQPMYLSVIVIIDTLKNDSGLLVRTNPKTLDKNSLEHDHYYEYKKGMLAVWPGNLVHSVKPFTPLTKDDVRITMQCHIAINSSKGIIFW